MTWADSVPNLLIGLREGLEAGLVVSILLAAVRKTAPDGECRVSTAPVWLGVLGAVMLAGSFAAVLTFSASVLASRAQEAVGRVLSLLAVGLVTAMIFWMRRTAAGLAAHLRGEVRRAALIGAGALTVTAFLAVGREGLETTLLLWTAARASGQTIAPLEGAATGLATAAVLCWLLYRRAIKLNVGAFFNRTAIALIVIAAGVLAYGLGDLQDAGLLPGHAWLAFDLSAHVDPGSWWVSIITGITDLSPRMTVLRVVAWLACLPWSSRRSPPAARPLPQAPGVGVGVKVAVRVRADRPVKVAVRVRADGPVKAGGVAGGSGSPAGGRGRSPGCSLSSPRGVVPVRRPVRAQRSGRLFRVSAAIAASVGYSNTRPVRNLTIEESVSL